MEANMKEERLEILKMVADKVISVEEGERLLRALDKSPDDAGAGRSGHHGPRHKHHGDWDLGERLGEMGFKMQEFFDNAFGSMFGDEYWFDGYETVTGPAEDIVLDDEATLVISNPKNMYRSGSGDIRISPSSDGHLRLSSGERGTFEILRKDKKFLILCKDDISVQVPRQLARLKLVLAKGKTKIDGLSSSLEVRSMKGDISIRDASRPVTVRSMAGDVQLELSDSYAGKTEVSALHGDIEVTVGSGYSGRVEAKTAHGQIRLQAQAVKTASSKNTFFRQETAEIGSADPQNLISLKTMNGDVTVRSKEGRS
jgi:hypothetical protein